MQEAVNRTSLAAADSINDYFTVAVIERDIDLLLLEEFISSIDFQQWFLTKTLGAAVRLSGSLHVHHSKSDTTGESDLVVVFEELDSGPVCFLIENKIGASFQRKQANRYHLRGQTAVQRRECAVYYTVLVAPEKYFGQLDEHKGFTHRLTYEELIEFFENANQVGRRAQYKTGLLRRAIEKSVRGSQSIDDAPATNFWQAYWNLANQYAPELEMKWSEGRPSGSGFIHFLPVVLPREIHIVHKLAKSAVDLQFNGMGRRLHELRLMFSEQVDADMGFEPTKRSGSIRISVPVLNPGRPFDEQSDAALEGLQAAKRLLTWFLAHRHIWEERNSTGNGS